MIAVEEQASEARELFETPEQRVEGVLKVTGGARYAGDWLPPGTLWSAILLSPLPHARIVSVDTSAALELPGVHSVITGADVQGARFGRFLLDWPVLAWDRVRFVGDRVAAVAAETPEIAEEALKRIHVEYEELPAVLDAGEALAPDAPILHPAEEASQYVFFGGTLSQPPHPNLQGQVLVHDGEADIERSFAGADRVFEHTFTTPRQHHGYIEPHTCLVWLEPDGTLRVISTNKSPFGLRKQLSAVTGLPEPQIVVSSAFIGGDFGGKGLSVDEFVGYYLARATGRPIKAVMPYTADIQGTNPRPSSVIRLKTGVMNDGTFVAHEAEVLFDGGAYRGAKPSPLAAVAGTTALGCYVIPNRHIVVKSVYTNKAPAGNMRAPGEMQGLWAGENHVDIIAREMGIDPFELRLKNAIRPGLTGAGGETYHQPLVVEVLDAVKRESGWDDRPLAPGRGRGIAVGLRHIQGGKTNVTYRLRPDGRINAILGTPDQGSGSHTMVRRIAAGFLSVAPERIVVSYGDTATAEWDGGAGASRVTHVVGQAAMQGAVELKEKLQDLAAEVLGWPSAQVRLQGDRFTDGAGGEVSFEEVASLLGNGPAVQVIGQYEAGPHHHDEPAHVNFFGMGIEIEVDPDTGNIRICDSILVADVGAVINPIAHQGQLDGGIVYGFGGALLEELRMDEGRITNPSLADYKLPTICDLTPLRTSLLRTEIGPGPLGAKAAGEICNQLVAPALANAVADATGVRLVDLPISAEQIRAALAERPEALATA